jgi:hypothetical protein
MAKILICEDSLSTARRLEEECLKDFHIPIFLVHESDLDYLVNHIEGVVLLENPDYLIIEDLHWKGFQAIDNAKKGKPDLKVLVYTSDKHFYTRAKNKGFPAFIKKSQQESDNMFMYIIEQERDK